MLIISPLIISMPANAAVPCPLVCKSSSWPNAMLWFAAVSWPDGFEGPSCHDLALWAARSGRGDRS